MDWGVAQPPGAGMAPFQGLRIFCYRDLGRCPRLVWVAPLARGKGARWGLSWCACWVVKEPVVLRVGWGMQTLSIPVPRPAGGATRDKQIPFRNGLHLKDQPHSVSGGRSTVPQLLTLRVLQN